MMEKTITRPNPPSYMEWLKMNHSYLETEMRLLRLLLQRRILWLRQLWKSDPLQNYQGQVISDNQADQLLEGEDRIAEQKFYREDSEAQKITRAFSDERCKLEGQADLLFKSGTPTPLDVITRIFGLSSFDRSILLLCLAPEIDSGFERLYAYVQDDVTRKNVTPYLVISLFATDADSEMLLRRSFLPESSLIKYKLIAIQNSLQPMFSQISTPLRIDHRIAEYLLGVNHLDERISEFLKPVLHLESFPSSYEKILKKVQSLIENNKNAVPLPSLNFTGFAASGKKEVASQLCESLRIDLFRLDAKKLQALKMDWRDTVDVLERECMLFPAAIYIDTQELNEDHGSAKTFLDDLLDRLQTFFIVSSSEPLHCDRELLTISIPKLSASEQSYLWKTQLEKYGFSPDGQIDGLVEQFDFEPDLIVKTIKTANAKSIMKSRNSRALTFDKIWEACRELGQIDMGNRAQRLIPGYTWDDIILPEESLEQLKDIAAQVAYRALVYEKWGFGAKMSRGRGIGVLFSGPSGTGKTMAAEILANHLKLDLYRIDLSGVVSKYIGETEKNLRHVFDAAEKSGVILFFDEADALFGKRSEVKDSHDRYANIEINYLLQRMEEYRGFAILATNMKSLLDQAFLRRLRFHVDFPFLDAEYRLKIWQKVFPSQTVTANLDFNFLARLEIPGGNIKNIALNAAFLAADNGGAIEMDHILLATKREYDKTGKIILESEFGSYYEKVKQ